MKKYFIVILAVVVVAGVLVMKTKNSPNSLPIGSGETRVSLKIGQKGAVGDLTVTPQSIVSDSRCAQGVQCIWAGTVQVNTELISNTGKSNPVLELSKPLTIQSEELTLETVLPEAKAGTTIKPTDYLFTFLVKKR